MYQHYRKKLNFSYDNIKASSLKLKQAFEMIETIQQLSSQIEKSSNNIEILIDSLIPDFEKNINDDLNVKQAFDGIFKTLFKLMKYSRKNEVTRKNADRISAALRNIDSVLQVFKLSL